MKPKNDEEIQRMLDSHDISSLSENAEAKVYQRLYEALAVPPTLRLSESFADRVNSQAMQLQQKHTYWQNVLVAILTITSLLLSALAVYYTSATFFERLTQLLLQTKDIIAFATISLVLVQLADHWLVKKAR